MKKYYFLLTISFFILVSCVKSPTDKAQSAVAEYLKANLKNPESYEPISFSKLDTLEKADTSETKRISFYMITHIYSITNSVKDKAEMTISFLLDKDLQVNISSTKSINGDYSVLTGNVYWKYNNFVGNKADAGAEVKLFSLDTIRKNLKFETTADVQGNYSIDKILPGTYFLIVRSENTTDCPERHIQNLNLNSSELIQIFNFDMSNYKAQLQEINRLDSTYIAILLDSDDKKHGSLFGKINKYTSIEKEMREKAEKLIESFPQNFKRELELYSGYSNSFDFKVIEIEEGKTENNNTDFGTTCI